jgi:hypothetical protein
VDDGAVALTILAKLMPCFNAQRTLKEILQAINSAVGSTPSWVVVEQDGDFQHESAGRFHAPWAMRKPFWNSRNCGAINMRGVLSVGDDRLVQYYFLLLTMLLINSMAVFSVN